MRKGHLITCLNLSEIRRFENTGYVGLGPFYAQSASSDRIIGARLRILWDVIADLKRVQPNDICFLHSEGQIFGPYIFTSTFRESRDLPEILCSSNLTYPNWTANKQEFSDLVIEEYGYVASISKAVGCNSDGANLMNLFLNQSKGIFNGIPPRFMYGDTKKIVKPLLAHEIAQLLSIVQFNGDWQYASRTDYSTNDLAEISLDLSDHDGHLYCEKLLEGWFMENMSGSASQYENLVSLVGNFDYYANSIYTYYTNFLDVIAYNIQDDYELKTCTSCNNVIRDFANDIRVIELKRDTVRDVSDVLNQIKNYMKWAKAVLNPNTQVSGYVVAAGFNRVPANEDNISFLEYTVNDHGLTLAEVIP